MKYPHWSFSKNLILCHSRKCINNQLRAIISFTDLCLHFQEEYQRNSTMQRSKRWCCRIYIFTKTDVRIVDRSPLHVPVSSFLDTLYLQTANYDREHYMFIITVLHADSCREAAALDIANSTLIDPLLSSSTHLFWVGVKYLLRLLSILSSYFPWVCSGRAYRLEKGNMPRSFPEGMRFQRNPTLSALYTTYRSGEVTKFIP